MPPLVHASVAWLAGLYAAAWLAAGGHHGVAATSAAVLAMAGLALAWWWRVGSGGTHDGSASSVLGPLAMVVAAALLTGTASARREAACARGIARQPSVLVALDERASPGARVAGRARGDGRLAGCRVRASVRVEEGRAPPGAVVRVQGASTVASRGGRSALRLDGTIGDTESTDRMRAWRGRAGETIDTLFGRDAALVRALLIADQDGIAPATRDRFADAGLVHMLSISGLHVAIIAGALLTLAAALRLPRVPSMVGALVAVSVYVLVLGAPPPAVRSAIMLATVSASEVWQRPVHPWTALALGAMVPTVDPGVVLDLGWQLSVSGMASLVAARALLRRARQAPPVPDKTWRAMQRRLQSLDGWRWNLLRETATGVVATLVTAPLIAWTFGRVSLVAPLANIVAGPVVAFLQPLLFLAMLLAPWDAGARFVAGASRPTLQLLDQLAATAADVPMAALQVAPTLFGAVCAGVASAALVRATASSRMAPGMVTAVAALALAVWAPLFTPGSGALELHVLDVGQGDALALRTPRGRWVVVDAGRAWDGGDVGRRVVVPYLRRRGGAVAAFVLTHAHDDHVGGAASVVDALRPGLWWEPAFATPSQAYERALERVRERGTAWRRVGPGHRLRLDGVEFEVLAPDSAWTRARQDANETSVVLRVRHGAVSFLLTGDAEVGEEEWLVTHHAEALRADVLKLGHHGSRTSSTPRFLDAVRPRLGVVSVGADNRYGHPSPEVLARFAARGIPLSRTDRDGTIVVSTDGRAVHVTAAGDRWTVAPR